MKLKKKRREVRGQRSPEDHPAARVPARPSAPEAPGGCSSECCGRSRSRGCTGMGSTMPRLSPTHRTLSPLPRTPSNTHTLTICRTWLSLSAAGQSWKQWEQEPSLSRGTAFSEGRVGSQQSLPASTPRPPFQNYTAAELRPQGLPLTPGPQKSPPMPSPLPPPEGQTPGGALAS